MSTAHDCYVSINGNEEGPLSFADVLARLGRGEIQLTDYMYNEVLKDWVPLLEVPAIQEHFRAHKPAQKPNQKPFLSATSEMKPLSSIHGAVRDWFVLKWDTRVGPFSTLDLIRMLQEKAIFEFEFIWKQGMDGWKRIADLEDFQAAKVRQLYEREKNPVFISREHTRVAFPHSFMAHEGNHLWRGTGLEISAGGARIKMDYAVLLPGQIATLHVNGAKNFEAMNLQCEIVGKKFQAGRLDRFTTVEYLVKFISLEERNRHVLKNWIAKSAS